MKISNDRKIDVTNWNKVFSQCLLFLILPPFIGIPMILNQIINKKNASSTDYLRFMACIALYMACINATRLPGGDQVQYGTAYLNVPAIGFIRSLMNIYGYEIATGGEGSNVISSEFMNGVYNYVGYYLTLGYYPLFESLVTFFDYFLIFLGFYKYAQSIKKPHIPIVCGVISLAFFYLFFTFTLHIQKQFLAQAMMMYVLGSYSQLKRMNVKLWVITVMAFFTHNSMILFIPFLVIKQLNKKLNKSSLFILSVMLVFIILNGGSMAENLSIGSDSILSQSMNKIASSDGKDDGLGGVEAWRLVVFGLPLLFIVVKKIWFERKSLDDKAAFVLNVVFMLFLSIFAMYNKPLAQYRYFMMVYAFMPFIFPYISNKLKQRDKYLKYIATFMVVFFFFWFNRISFNFAPEFDVITYSPIYLIFANYNGF